MTRRASSFLVATLAASLAGCETPSSSLCDPGQVLDPATGYCIAAPTDGGQDGGTNPSSDASVAGDGVAAGDAGCSPGTSMLGDPCATLSDCHCPTDYCAVMPGATMGTCTQTGCDVNPSICPASYTCLDLGLFQPGLPSVCYK
jgi:hypothetical protein